MSLIPSLLLSFFFMQTLVSPGSAAAEERRSDVRAVLGEPTEPGFWPTRGRRSGAVASEDLQPPTIFWLQHNRQLLPVTLCGDIQQLQRYTPDSRNNFPLKDTSQLKSWMRA